MVIVIIAILAAIAMPRFVNMGRDARIAAVTAGMGAIASAQSLANAKCRLTPGCDNSNSSGGPVAGPAGQLKYMYYGYPSGEINNASGYYGIDEWVQMDGFNRVRVTVYGGEQSTEFQLVGAPDPTQCKATYFQHGLGVTTFVALTTSGC